mgnify:CR=1 FL=1
MGDDGVEAAAFEGAQAFGIGEAADLLAGLEEAGVLSEDPATLGAVAQDRAEGAADRVGGSSAMAS